MLDEGALVLEGVTLAQVVELVVEVLVDLAAGTVLDEETAEDTEAAHPEDLAIFRPHQQAVHAGASNSFPNSPFEQRLSLSAASPGVCAYLGIRASLVPFLLP